MDTSINYVTPDELTSLIKRKINILIDDELVVAGCVKNVIINVLQRNGILSPHYRNSDFSMYVLKAIFEEPHSELYLMTLNDMVIIYRLLDTVHYTEEIAHFASAVHQPETYSGVDPINGLIRPSSSPTMSTFFILDNSSYAFLNSYMIEDGAEDTNCVKCPFCRMDNDREEWLGTNEQKKGYCEICYLDELTLYKPSSCSHYICYDCIKNLRV